MAKITVQQISRRAKATRKTGESWLHAIKRASKELKGSKVGATTPKKKKPVKRRKTASKKTSPVRYRQTGTSNKKNDRERKAKAPGKRKSKTGRVYFERRKNRSDVPGTLAGVKATLKSHYTAQLSKGLLARDMATNARQHKAAVKTIAAARKGLSAFK